MSNWKTKVLSIVLGFSVLVPTASFAADTVTAPVDLPSNAKFNYHQRFDGEQGLSAQDNILGLVSKYAPDNMEEWQSVIAEREQLMSELKEQAPEQRPILSDEMKEKLQAVREAVKNGTMTQEQAAEELKELGLEKAGEIKQRPELSDEVKEELEAVREAVKNGTMTREQASEEFEKLGLQGKRDLPNQNNIMVQLDSAVESGDESTIKDLLAQLLEQMKEKNQQLSTKLSEIN
ncbi:hypothetical protein [Desulfoscipio gibsoniae]|uniref:DUF5667 domain-containing protein n=1 Tax=Desulfoscipio gibsoniae DSM 7213 TaxID=767817 RepID=R4KCF2_9FIRM|nr:hypothetical protein [Desulfoscipio gibsoniae]AGL00863.1 hypothetical protein Desgi_1357 [Desulfoscipio gibsoniae DSM 7213]